MRFLGLRKKLENLAKAKDCEIVGCWTRSIINHLYWCVTSTTDGNVEMMEAKWLSLVNHIHNQHSGHGRLFPKCSHGKIRGRRKKKWIKWRKIDLRNIIEPAIIITLDSKASEKLYTILTNKLLLKDISRLSFDYQTSSLESFHNVLIHFASKSICFSYEGMDCRCVRLFDKLCILTYVYCMIIGR